MIPMPFEYVVDFAFFGICCKCCCWLLRVIVLLLNHPPSWIFVESTDGIGYGQMI